MEPMRNLRAADLSPTAAAVPSMIRCARATGSQGGAMLESRML